MMRFNFAYVLFPVMLVAGNAYAALAEKENNDTLSTATPLAKTDDTVGQLNSPDDADWFSVEVTDAKQVVTPVYFGCNFKLGDLFTDGASASEKSHWRVSYFDSTGVMQGNYVVSPENCKQGAADTKGPLRFEMNTQVPGTYYVRVIGNYLGMILKTVYDADPATGGYQYDDKGQLKEKKIPIPSYIANTGAYKIRAYTGRADGEMEPNDGMSDAFAISKNSEIRGQSSSQYDEDWYYFDNNAATNTAKTTSLYFKCGDAAAGATYLLSAYDAQGVLQRSHELSQAQCATDTGLKVNLYTPSTGRYYLLVSPPTYTDSATFSQADYIVSTTTILTPTTPGTTTDPNAFSGTLNKVNIADSPNAGKDTFSATVGQCGTTKGTVKLTGSNLNLSGLTADAQVKVIVDGWSCTSDAKTTTTKTSNGKSTYVYPAPVTKPAPVKIPAGFS
ncbi:MAG: hypothetical protein ABL925_02445 [Methylococcales bacterium]